MFSTDRVINGIGFELVLGFSVITLLGRRGWRWGHLTRPFEPRDLLRALGVLLMGYLVFIAGGLLAWALDPVLGLANSMEVKFRTTSPWELNLLLSTINPFYEELLWLGFAISGPASRRLGPALAWSVGCRTIVHFYQGPLAFFSIAPLGFWYFRYYWRTGRLWPVILAHGLLDLIAMVGWQLLRNG